MSLTEYRRKRRFTATPEPSGGARAVPPRATLPRLHYVIHKHHARSLHYDFRLEWHGVLLSWAVPKGPSTDPGTKRLAVRVEDHPLEYAKFEGRIPEGQYGAGTVVIWDEGYWYPDDPNVDAALRRGELGITLVGRRLKGAWVLVRTRFGPAGRARQSWLLIKRRETAGNNSATGRRRRPRRSTTAARST